MISVISDPQAFETVNSHHAGDTIHIHMYMHTHIHLHLHIHIHTHKKIKRSSFFLRKIITQNKCADHLSSYAFTNKITL